MSKKILITGSGGLIGSEAVEHFANLGYEVVGIDNNMRKEFFGEKGDTSWRVEQLKNKWKDKFIPQSVDIRKRDALENVFANTKFDAIIHCAAQPSHDKAKDIPFDDFDVNAVGTLNLLEMTRRFCSESPFVFMSTNKVYGDAPNEIDMREMETRYEYEKYPYYKDGIDESMRIDNSKHSIFGASKVAADIMVQEYGKYFGMKTAVLRGGCLTGPNHSGVELHGFLSYLIKVAVSGGTYKVFGYKGKQVRDNIHSYDVVRAMEEIINNPKSGGPAYNIGGGYANSVSILEVFHKLKNLYGIKVKWEYIDQNRSGDHICYYTNNKKLKEAYPNWDVTIPIERIIMEIVIAEAKAKNK